MDTVRSITAGSKKEFSKKILDQTKLIFISQLIAATIFAWFGKDTSIFVYTIPSTGGIYGAAIVFYLNKAKIENCLKGKEEFLKLKLKLMKDHSPDQQHEIENELLKIDEALTSKVDQTMIEAIQEDITIQI